MLTLPIRNLFLFFSCLFFIAGHAQVNRQYIFHHLNLQDGLLSDETNATVQDAKGYIWIAGKNGLQRYDGHRFVDFKRRDGDSNALPHNNITQLVIDKQNRLWLLTAGYRLGYFDINRFIFHEVKVSYNGRPVDKPNGLLKLDLQKNILLVLNDNKTIHNVLRYDEQKKLFAECDTRFKIPVNWHIYNFSVDSLQHNYWIAANEGLIKLNATTGKYSYRGHNEDNDAIINALRDYTLIENTLLTTDGNFWMNSANADRKSPHLIQYIATQNKVYDYAKEINSKSKNSFTRISSIMQLQKDEVWITGRGVFILADDKLNFITSDMPGQYSIHYDEIRNINFDRESNCWISTNNGIYRINMLNAGFRYIDEKKYIDDSIYTSDVVDFLHLPNGNILTASWGNGLFEYDNKFNPVKSEIVDQGDRKQEKLIWALHRRSNGDIWSAHQDGNLYIYHASNRSTQKLHDPVFENKTIRQIAEDRNGDLWLGTQEAVIKWQQATNKFKLIQKTTEAAFRLYADKNGDIWALAGEVIKFDAGTDTIAAKYKTGNADGKHLIAGDIVDILQYSDSIYVIATEGLNFVNIKNGSVRYFTSANGLPTDYISNIILDKQHTLWVFTENGVCNLDLAKHHLSIYNIEDGISNSAFTPTSSTLLNDGRIAVGTVHNIFVFDPLKINNYSDVKPNVEITGISISNKPVNTDSLLMHGNVRLSYTQNSIGIEFSTLSYRNDYGVAYKLEGLDKEWIDNKGRNEAVYSYLPPGNYVFKVGIDTTGGIKTSSSFKFTIVAPFYKRWLFYFVILLLAAIIVWRINRERVKRIKDILHMRSNIGKELHNEVSNTLKNISVLSEIAAMKADDNPEQSKDYIKEIKSQSRSTVVAMDDVMWSIDPANDSMLKITEKMHEIADAIYHEYSAEINIDINRQIQHYHLSMKERLEFMLIYKKAVLMFGKDMKAKHIAVSLERKKNNLLLKLITNDCMINGVEKIIETDMQEIKGRAVTIQCEVDLQVGDTYTAFMVVIRRR